MSAERPQPSARRILRVSVRVVVPVAFALSLLHLFTNVVRFGYVVSSSMEPTLLEGEFYLVRLHVYGPEARPQRGDIIVFSGPDGEPYVKRVIGLPGDRLFIVGGNVALDGEWLTEPYVKERPGLSRPIALQMPPDRVFVLGDNRNLSEDSRDYGPVPVANIIGRVTRTVWPLRRARVLTPPEYAP